MSAYACLAVCARLIYQLKMKFNAAPLGILCVQCVFVPFLAPIKKLLCHLNSQHIRVEAKTQKRAIEEAKVK